MQTVFQQVQSQRHSLSQHMQQSLRILGMGLQDLRTYLYEQQQSNPLLEISDYDACDTMIFSLAPEREHVRKSADIMDRSSFELNIPQPKTYREELAEMLNIYAMTEEQISCAKYIIASLDDDGYLREPVTEIIKATGCRERDVFCALQAVQDLDPAGIGARNLQECLLLQLRRLGRADPLTVSIVKDFLEDIAERRYRYIAKCLQVKEKQVRQAGEQISRLSPRPAAIGALPQYIVPDVIVQDSGSTLEIQVNTKSLPQLTLNQEYLNLARGDMECAAYLKPFREKANATVYSLQFRTHTLTRVAEQIIHRQEDFFRYDAPLAPCSLCDLADDLDLSESTISRAVNGKYILCKQGVFSLRNFLSRGVQVAGGIYSVDDIRRAIAETIRQGKYANDSEIAQLLSEQGVPIARRTVAKYRAQMGIRASHKTAKKC